jgi:hypothetical protein
LEFSRKIKRIKAEVSKLSQDQGPDHIQDERRDHPGERGEAIEACCQGHDGGADGNGGILELAESLLNISNYLLLEIVGRTLF